jgi:hypothetical protein
MMALHADPFPNPKRQTLVHRVSDRLKVNTMREPTAKR